MCPNVVCERVLAEPRAVHLISYYWSACSCVLMITEASCFVTICNSLQAQGFALDVSIRQRRTLKVYRSYGQKINIWFLDLDSFYLSKLEPKSRKVQPVLFFTMCWVQKHQRKCNLRASSRCFLSKYLSLYSHLYTDVIGHQACGTECWVSRLITANCFSGVSHLANLNRPYKNTLCTTFHY